MTLLLVLGILLAGAAAGLIWRAIAVRVGRGASLGHIDQYGYAVSEGPLEPATGLFESLTVGTGAWLGERFTIFRTPNLQSELVSAGLYRTTPRQFVGYRVLCFGGFPLVWIWFSKTLHLPSAVGVLGVIVAVILGLLLPLRFLRSRREARFQEIEYEMPELIDLLVVTVEAGLGFVGALRTAGERLRGPLGDELRLTLQEQDMGLSTTECLTNLAIRAHTPAVRSFVRSVTQGEALGVSIGTILRDLSQDMRRRRRSAAEERAQKAPVKMLFPLVLLIFPAMLIVLLGPAVILLMHSFSGQ